jgi:hypothetical protein
MQGEFLLHAQLKNEDICPVFESLRMLAFYSLHSPGYVGIQHGPCKLRPT